MIAGTADWNTKGGGNHDWVEVWLDRHEGWSFTGPGEYTPEGWNSTWFFPEPVKRQVPGSMLHGVFATSWQTTPSLTYFPMTWAPDIRNVNAL